MRNTEIERLFSGLIGEEYELLRVMHPEAAEMSKRVGEFVSNNGTSGAGLPLKVLEIGCGTGITTLALLNSREDIHLTSVDNEPTMLNQARQNLSRWIEKGQVILVENDALSALCDLPDDSLDMVASAYTLHNFLNSYREKALAEILRALKPGGIFVNGDRYGLDDFEAHTQQVQTEVKRYFEVLMERNRTDVLEQWILHLFSDESPHHVMRTQPTLQTMEAIGFYPVEEHYRQGINALVSGRKPKTS
ncbi:Methyltransferase type 11 [Nitrosococcus halophilus Nc 4]|uniref:Methyltransferase type 11 n=1 Tax=Nitrosococcus halophilus (strain Nc4) TaxID=472759 RepID=D5C3B7_NITHN|nr:class I SAM-dependent methyltransferase [Nitrosococcus halophilus]ADE16824.1 Methyltransferase type 11 [Nitrosococcus halophilus Nc 4]